MLMIFYGVIGGKIAVQQAYFESIYVVRIILVVGLIIDFFIIIYLSNGKPWIGGQAA